jgi:hypothetical protein
MDPLAGARGGVPLLPTYRPRAARETVHAKEAEAEREVERKLVEKKEKQERAERTRLEVADKLEKEQQAAQEATLRGKAGIGGEDRPDDRDRPEDEAAALQAWKVRELSRLVRDRMERLGIRLEQLQQEPHPTPQPPPPPPHGQPATLGQDLQRVNRGAFYVDESSLAGPSDVRLRVAPAAEIAAATYRQEPIRPLYALPGSSGGGAPAAAAAAASAAAARPTTRPG